MPKHENALVPKGALAATNQNLLSRVDMNSPAPTRLQKPQIYKRRELTKTVVVEVLSQNNKKVIQRYRFVPPTNATPGQKKLFTPANVERVLENFIFSFERDNPDHRYRLVECADKFRLVWIPEEKPDAQAEEMKEMVEAARQMSPEELNRELRGPGRRLNAEEAVI